MAGQKGLPVQLCCSGGEARASRFAGQEGMHMMEYRQLGRTGLTVSAIGCGTWELGGREWGEDRYRGRAGRPAPRLRPRGSRSSIPPISTVAGAASGCWARRSVGQSDVVIATKVGYPLESRTAGLSGAARRRSSIAAGPCITTAVEGSLRRLRREAIDLYQLHQAPPPEQWDEAFATLEDLKRVGKIRHYGTSVSVETGLRVLRETGAECLMFVYNLLAPEPEAELLPLAELKRRGGHRAHTAGVGLPHRCGHCRDAIRSGRLSEPVATRATRAGGGRGPLRSTSSLRMPARRRKRR